MKYAAPDAQQNIDAAERGGGMAGCLTYTKNVPNKNAQSAIKKKLAAVAVQESEPFATARATLRGAAATLPNCKKAATITRPADNTDDATAEATRYTPRAAITHGQYRR